MAENNFIFDFIGSLLQSKSKKQIKEDIKNMGDIKFPLVGTLSPKTKAQLKQDIASLNGTVNLTGKVDSKGIATSVQQATQQAQKQVDSRPVEVAFSVKKEKLLNDIKLLAQQNSKLFKNSDMTIKYNSLLDNAELAKNTVELSALRTQLGSFRSELKVTGNSGLTMTDALKNGLSKVLRLFGSSGIIMQFTKQLHNAWTEAQELDKSMTDLSRVNSEITRSGFPDYLDRVIDKTKKLAVTTKDYIDSVTTFSRAGYNLTDSEILADMAVQLEKVGDMSAVDASKALLAGLQGYAEIDGYGMDQLAEKAQALNDKIDLIGNTASITQAEVAQGIQAVGSVMSDANTSVDEFIALLGAGNRAVQDSDKVALAIRTSALRIRGCTAELEEMGEETDSVVESTSKLAEKIEGLTNINGSGGVKILEADEETFRSIYDIYNDIAKVYDKMSDKDASALLDLIAGKNRSNQISAILQNMSEANELLESSLSAAGTASEEYQIYLDSVEAATERFGVAMTEAYSSIISGDTVKGLANTGAAVLDFANSWNILEGTIKGFLTLGILKGVTTLTVAFKNSALQISNYGNALNAVKDMSKFADDATRYASAFNLLKTSCVNLTDAQLKQVLANRNLEKSQLIEILQLDVLEEEQNEARLSQLGLIQTTETQTVAQGAATASTFSLSAAIKGLGASIKAAFMANPIGVTILSISVAFSVISTVISKYKESVVEASEATKEAIEAFESISSEVESLEDKLSDLNEQINQLDPITDTEDIANLQLETEELEKQLAILKEKQRIASADADKSAQKSLGMTEASRYKTEDRESAYGGVETGAAYVTKDEELLNAIEAYEEYKAKVDEANDALAHMAETGDYAEKEWDEQEKVVSTYSDKMDDARAHANELATSLDEQKQGLNGSTDASQTLLTKIEDVITQYNQWLNLINGTTEALEEQAEVEEDASNNITQPVSLSISQTIDQLNTQLKPAFDSLKSAYQDIYNDDGVFDLKSIDILSTCDSIKSKLDELNEIDGIRVDYASFENLVNVLSNTESTEKQVEDAFDSLADSITEAALNGTEDFNTMKSVLENLGLENGELVAFDALISNTKALKEAGLDLANASDAQIQAFANESVSAENTAQAYNMLTFHKELCNLQEMNTAGEVANLKTLAENAGYTGEVIQYLTEMEQIYQEVASGTLTPTQIGFKLARAVALKAMIEGAASKVQYAPKMDWSGAVKDAGKAGRDSGKSYKDALKEQLSDLESVISGITGRIDDQISSINEQKSAALDSIDEQKEALEEAKDQALEAIEQERQARLDAIEEQRKQIENSIKEKQKIIDSIQDEIKAMQDANEERKREIDLQKAKYELERMQNQRTKLVYSESKGMHYENDSQGIFDAKEQVRQIELEIEIANKEKQIDLIEKEIDLLNDKLDILDEEENRVNDFYDNLSKQTEAYYDQQIKNLEKQRKETEKFYSSITKSLEQRKEKFQELTEILEKAELSAKLKQLGIDEEALLNGSEEEFEKLKNAYMDIVFKLNEGNDEVLNSLRELSGYDGTAPTVLEESNDKLGTMNDELGEATRTVDNVNSSLSETASTTDTVATNVGTVVDGLNQMPENGKVSGLASEFETLATKIGEVAKALGIGEGEAASTLFQAMSDLNNVTLGSEGEGIIGQFTLLRQAILDVIETIGLSEAQTVGSLMSAIAQLNSISLDESIIKQFTSLKEAIDSVTSAISGGGGESSEGEGSGSGSGSKGRKGSEGKGKGESGGDGNSLTGAIKEMGETAKEVIGESDAEGDGTVIGEFGSMKTAVNDVTTAISGGDSEGGEGSNSEGDSGNLIGSIVDLGETTHETLGEPDGDGVIGKFEQFKQPIQEADEHVHGISDGLAAIDGQEVECTIRIKVESDGFPAYASGTALGAMNLNSAEYNAKYTGNAHVSGTANVTGNWGVRKPGKSLVGELGQEIWVHSADGTFETVGDNGPEWIKTAKGDLIFNHLQTKELLDKGNIVKTGKAYANGNIQYSDGMVIRPNGEVLEPYDPDKDNSDFSKFYKAWNAYYGDVNKNVGEINKKLSQHLVIEHNQKVNKEVDQFISNSRSIVNNTRNVQQPVINGGINITCPGVTSKEVAQQVGVEVGRIFNGMHLEAEQRSRMR